ncbi:unnamed protein product [Didymodactylos carnosus]|uniref:NHL repeat containing protein n=1 Tax=Didymodactylos carnosus TaxID=1234261 RepID=A0A815SSD0_9BILA|nr:unnamed protein product [Didymodactylos carnosus]CAF4359139.1 unnamed protein product [Didymodactylos carnosus]
MDGDPKCLKRAQTITSTSCSPYVYNTNTNAAITYSGGGLSSPYGVAVDSANNLYIADSVSVRKYAWNTYNYSSGGIIVAPSSTTQGSTGTQFGSVLAICTDSDSNLYISDINGYSNGYSNYRIQKWDNGAVWGPTVAGGNSQGPALNQISTSFGIYVDWNYNLYASDNNYHRVTKWAPYSTIGILVAGNNGSGSNATQLNSPRGVFVDQMGNVYDVDTGNHRVQKWNVGATFGVTVAGGNGQGQCATQLNNPTAIYLRTDGVLFVLDAGNQRIVQWSPNAAYGVTVFDGSNGVFSVYTYAMTMDLTGNLYVADAHRWQVKKIEIISTGACGK